MNTSRNILTGLLFLALLFLLGCSQSHSSTLMSAPNSVVTVTDLTGLTQGGVVETDSSLSQNYGLKNDALSDFLPESVSITQDISPSESGGGYILQLNWNYTAASADQNGNSETDWDIFEDDNNLENVSTSSFQRLSSQMRDFPVTYRAPKTFTSGTLLRGHVYVFYLSSELTGSISATDNSSHILYCLCRYLFKKIVVDLRF